MWLGAKRTHTAQSGISRRQYPFATLLELHRQPEIVSTTRTRLATVAEIYQGKARACWT